MTNAEVKGGTIIDNNEILKIYSSSEWSGGSNNYNFLEVSDSFLEGYFWLALVLVRILSFEICGTLLYSFLYFGSEVAIFRLVNWVLWEVMI